MEHICKYRSPVGNITIACDGENLVGLCFGGRECEEAIHLGETEEKKVQVLEDTCKWLDIYFSGEEPKFKLPIHMRGSDFRKMVWEILLTIPYGETTTYGEIARIIEKRRGIFRMSAQAVGGAVVHNPIAIVIPCHRVIGANGSLTGYAGGIEKKMRLLSLEKSGTDVRGSGEHI